MLLGSPGRSTFYRWKRDLSGQLPHDVLERISYILGIYKALHLIFGNEQQADAWITWVHWPLNHQDKADFVEIEPERRIYRGLLITKAQGADPSTQRFIDFIDSPQSEPFFAQDGWTR